MKKKVAINGYGTVGKRVADAVASQDDMEVVGVVKTRPSFDAQIALDKGFMLYTATKENLEEFKKSRIEVGGTLTELLNKADIVVDCTPDGIGEKNKLLYEKAGIKAIWQGGEEHEIAGFSFNSLANYDAAIGRNYTRVVSCNTTALTRVLYLLDRAFGVDKARVTLIRRAADPNDIKTGPINAIVPDIQMPSHHGPDVQTILPHINIATVAVKVPTTLMHLHAINIKCARKCSSNDVIDLFGQSPRIRLVSGKLGIKSTAQIFELGRDIGRPRNDMWENNIWSDSISIYDNELYFFQAVHQECITVPENIDAIRAMTGIEKDGKKSIEKTNRALGIKPN